MPLTHKQEQFAQLVANGSTQSDAYRMAYDTSGYTDKSIHENASKLANDAKVAPRIGEIQEEIRIAAGISLGYITKEILEDIKNLKIGSQSNNSAQRLMDLAKLHGLVVDKQEHSGSVAVQSLPWDKMYGEGDIKSES